MGVVVEVAVDSLAGVAAAERGGASRIELCAALSEGGLTPSLGTIRAARRMTALPIVVMIRPRGGDFVYSAEELRLMEDDIVAAKDEGVFGVVFGILDRDAQVDVGRVGELARLARPLSVTFHRAIDLTPDPVDSVERLRDTGIERILTSGGAHLAADGLGVVKRMVERAAPSLRVMPGSGVRPSNARQIMEATGAIEIHLSARSRKATTQSATPDSHAALFGEQPQVTDTRVIRSVVEALASPDHTRR